MNRDPYLDTADLSSEVREWLKAEALGAQRCRARDPFYADCHCPACEQLDFTVLPDAPTLPPWIERGNNGYLAILAGVVALTLFCAALVWWLV